MTNTQPEKVGESRGYWTHGVEAFPSPVAQFRMAQLVDLDDRLYETARVVYRFLVGWYHEEYGDAFMSMNHVAKTMKQRAPAGSIIPSRSAVHRAIIALMETGWVVRTFKGRGKGKGASRYVPVMNVLELAARGKFPEPSHATGTVEPSHSTGTVVSHATGTVEPSHSTGTVVSHATGTVDAEPSHATGIKTLLPDPRTDAETGKEDNDCAAPMAGLTAATGAQGGIDELYSVYGVRKEFSAARAAYEKLAPSPDLHAEMVTAATAWRTAGGGIERMHLARWIREERFREDPKGERKAKAKPAAPNSPTPEPANDDIRDFMIGSPRLWPVGKYVGEFIEGDVKMKGGDMEVTMTFMAKGGAHSEEVYLHKFLIESCIESAQIEGRAILDEICGAVGVVEVEDLDELLYKPLFASANGRKITYQPVQNASMLATAC